MSFMIKSLLKSLLVAIALALALLGAAPDTAQAAPQKDVIYNYYDVPLTDADGTTGLYNITGAVRYNRDGNFTSCGYGRKSPTTGNVLPVGGHRVEYAIADTSREGVLAFCTENFATRKTRV
jgi:hypothetical protein